MIPASTRRQSGATLLVSLIMLVVLTLFAVTMFNLSGVNLKIVGNFQQQRATEAVVQQGIEQLMSTVTAFNATPAATNICVNGTGTTSALCSASGGYWVAIDKPKCNYTTAAKGYTKKVGELTPEDTNWEVRASFTDPLTKASVALVQGLAVRMLAGNCPST
jgi:Tfp pilus assembly protein PilX